MGIKLNFNNVYSRILGIIVGSVLYALGTSLFLDPNDLAPGGVLGLSVILNRLTTLETGTLYFILNVPIMLLGLWKFGFRFIGSTAFCIALNSWFTNLFAKCEPITTDPLLASLAGSILVGLGVGIVFKAGATTGGSDIIVKVIRARYKHLKTGMIFLCSDLIVVSLSGLVFKNFNIVMYALIAVAVMGKVIDWVLYGGDEAKLFYIISDKPENIANRILKEIDIGITYLEGRGGFSNKKKQVIMCVARKHQGPIIEDIVKQEDKDAFTIITSANEIYGEGYKNIMSEKI